MNYQINLIFKMIIYNKMNKIIKLVRFLEVYRTR